MSRYPEKRAGETSHLSLELETRLEEQEARNRRDTLRFLIRSGRASTEEEAESYLAAIGHLKEKLLLIVRERLMEGAMAGIDEGDNTKWDMWGRVTYKGGAPRPNDLETLHLEDIDRNDRHVWRLQETVDETGQGERQATLLVRLKDKNHNTALVELAPDMWGTLAKKLQGLLSEEDLAFFKSEYRFTCQDLSRNMHAAADFIATGNERFHPGWERFLGEA
jgi:hypothetical protein